MPQTQSKEQIEQRVIDALVEFGEERENITPTARFEDLEVDSLDLVELAQIVEDEYGVEHDGDSVKDVKTVVDVIDLVVKRAS